MTSPFVPHDFDVPVSYEGPGFYLEPLGAEHNQRDHEAWMSSIDHIKTTPGFRDWDWPEPMSLEANLSDLVGHATDFGNRRGFTYSILDGNEVIGCVYIYPSRDAGHDASVRSWVRESRSQMDRVVWEALTGWLETSWPFVSIDCATRP
ncbi:MAG: N-acetyltransferase [Actinomycetota bacterium]|nr:N-acetyltransferase [Actinomycetota bacterium]